MSIDWRPPSDLPDLRRAGIIALDTETKDNGLASGRGSAWPWRDGHVCGVSVAYRAESTIRSLYFPLRHPDTANLNPDQVFQWLRDLIASDVRIVTQNGIYDYGWLRADAGINMPSSERIEEIGALATLVDENRYQYSLDALCKWRGLPGKDDALLREGCAALGLIPKGRKKFKPQTCIWQLPARYVGPYAEHDAASTLALFESLNPILDRENTRDAYRLECDLLPMVLEMRRRGIRIDTAAAERARELLLQKRDAAFTELSKKLGANVGMAEIGRTTWLVETFDAHKLVYPRTEKGNPSFTAGNRGWMTKHPHWLPQLITRADKLNHAAVHFLEQHILGHVEHGRIHAEIHPHRSDDGGTRSLRFSYSNPPLQQMPAHDTELAPLIRGVFLPEEGEVWAKPDLSQQEFRFIVHYAARHKLRKAAEAVECYRSDPNTDFHAFVASMTGIDRQSAKTANFAKSYGAGVRTFASMIGKTESEARAIYAKYDHELPFVAQLSAKCEQAVWRTGYLTLYDGARRHWNKWAPGGKWGKGLGPCSRDEAEQRTRDPGHPWYHRKLWRTDVRLAFNALIQGSAARHTKLWMRACWREGIVPLLQLHDALECSVSSREQAELVAHLGCEAVALEVPMKVDLAFGRTWGDAKHTWEELHADPTGQVADDPGADDPGADDPGADQGVDHDPDRADDPELGDLQAQDIAPSFQCDKDEGGARARDAGHDQDNPGDPGSGAHADPGAGTRDDPGAGARASPPPSGNGQSDFSGFEHSRHNSDGNVHGDSGPKHGRRTAQWFYPHLDRSNYLRVDRYDNGERKFYQHHWDGKRWVHGVKGTYAERKIPYRLPELKAALQANPDVELQLCEGESDADALARLGFVVTTNPGGALSWTEDLTAWLRILGVRRAVIHEDNDGEAHGHKGPKRSAMLTAALSNFIKLKIVRYPDVPEGEDVRWWLTHGGHTKEELEARIAAAEPAALPFPFINMSNWDAEPVPEQQWIVPGRLPRRQSVIFSGEGGAGKSIILLHLSAATALSRDWLGTTPEQGPAFFIDCEDDQDVMHYRLDAIARHYNVCFADLIHNGLHLTSLVGQDTVMATVSRSGIVEPTVLYNRLLQAAGDIKPHIIGIAASANVFAGDENTRTQVQQFVNLTTRLAIAANGVTVLITHPSVTGINTGTGLSGSTQWHNAVRARFYLKSPKTEPGEQPDNDLARD